MIILSILALKNVRRIRSIPRQQQRQVRSMNKKDFQLLRCLYVHNVIYIIFTILVVVGTIYGTTLIHEISTPMEQAVSNFLNNTGAFLHFIPYCTSFIIFICVSKAFRLELKRMALQICRKDLTTVREEENNQQEPARDNLEVNNVVSTILLDAK